MRTTWNGSITFGLVSIPVGLAPATKPAARSSDVSFRMLHRECLTPIKQKRWCPTHDREVGPDEIAKGWEVSKGEFVIVEEGELEALEQDATSRSIEIAQFVPAGDVDPIYFDRTYYLVPGQQPAQRRPYALLLAAMRETETAALGSFVQAGKEKLCLIRPKGDGLALETLYVAEDVYSQAEIDEAVGSTDVKAAEVALARQIVEGLAADFAPREQLVSEYRESLRSLLEAKLAGAPPVKPEPVEELAPVVDLMEALKRSVAEAKKRRAPAEPKAAPAKPAKAAGRTGTRKRPAKSS